MARQEPRHPHLLVVRTLLAIALVAAAAVRARAAADHRTLHTRTAQLRHTGGFMSMPPKAFEHVLADPCRRDGCTKVTVVGGAGDLAADVLATTPTGRRILIQAKRYSPGTLVGSPDVQKVNGTYRDIHHCDLAAVVTTSSFTKRAAAFCVQIGIRMTDHRALALWVEGTGRPPGADTPTVVSPDWACPRSGPPQAPAPGDRPAGAGGHRRTLMAGPLTSTSVRGPAVFGGGAGGRARAWPSQLLGGLVTGV
ncbi:restriction endonuclease [Kitasatospora purpeofusca]|uniref:restriction endonuclease n=1 Tax=Kitasatospora purpeofusca TaxID=67352 RepID=UPI003654E488